MCLILRQSDHAKDCVDLKSCFIYSNIFCTICIIEDTFVNEEFVRIDNILTTYSTVVFKAIFILVFYVFAYWGIIVQMANFAYKELLNAT